jgi:acyl-CoA dehydrogenase
MRLSTDDLPMFFDASHVALAEKLRAVAPALDGADDQTAVQVMGSNGMFELVCPASPAEPGSLHGRPASGKTDARSLCLAREMLGYVSASADSIFAVQGLGVHSILLAGSAAQRAQMAAFARGERVAAVAVTEPEAG